MDNPSGYYDIATKTIYPESTSTWAGLTTWDSWTEWAYSTSDQIIYFTEPIFLGFNSTNVLLDVTCVSTGEVSYRIYEDDYGLFAGAETEHIINHGDQNIPSFRASNVMVVVYAQKTNAPLTISEVTIRVSQSGGKDYVFNDLDSSTLEGSVTERFIPVSYNVGTITDIKITPHEVTAYALDVYVANTATSTHVVPKIISKSASSPSFALVGMDNHPRDAVVDITVKTLNKSRMVGNNIVSD